MKTEAQIQTFVTRYLRQKGITCVYEVKKASGDKLYHSQLEGHQVDALLSVKKGTFTYKIPDVGGMPKPFDGFSVCGVPAYVVVGYGSRVVFMDIEKVMLQEKAISLDTALSIAEFSVIL